MTVSNAFSRPDQLSAELREKILAVAEEIGYCGPDPAARTLARGRSGAVGMVVPGSLTWAFTEAISVEFLAGVAEALEPAGLALTVLATPCDAPAPPLQGALMDGAIVHSISTESPVFDGLRRRRIPLVVVDDKPDAALDCVNVDDRGGAKLAAQHRVELGHRTVGLVAVGPADGPRQPSPLLRQAVIQSAHHRSSARGNRLRLPVHPHLLGLADTPRGDTRNGWQERRDVEIEREAEPVERMQGRLLPPRLDVRNRGPLNLQPHRELLLREAQPTPA